MYSLFIISSSCPLRSAFIRQLRGLFFELGNSGGPPAEFVRPARSLDTDFLQSKTSLLEHVY